ncbi:ABC transporter ATP-binding protein [Vannielia litorea]|uniref:Spermidine/putrescine import ATP-binding protein PotA n=1 Tax=Vannielia litorea TaxID=1217970 RepID=A0A1N6EMY9_9RHOB|nr:ABC transporter ATP-binding protein [Vannielia litorea]SIN84348.1 putative spermidine/putrescine transport system ATP-binding protein/spermidine/putrescine transport system ATP-binding protein [Vannielia litorea]
MLIDPKLHQPAGAVPAQPPARTAVKIDGVSKSFDGTLALEPSWLKVRKGEFLTLLGPSGCGKTTLLNLVAGFLEPDKGELFIDDALVTQVPVHRREIGIVFQNYALFPHMDVVRNVEYGLRTRGVAASEARARAMETLRLVKLEQFADRRPRQLSGGQQQRVALARALVIRPKVLLLDEPFSALDRNLRAAMQIELKEIQQGLGVTTIFVTHDQGEALSMSDRIAVMSKGRIRQIGTPEEIYASPADRFVGTFVGDANLLNGTVTARESGTLTLDLAGTSLTLPESAAPEAGAGAQVELFARPEACRLVARGTPGALPATVSFAVYQGAHVELHLACPAAVDGQLMLRLPVGNLPKVGEAVAVALPEAPVVFTGASQ